jgi:CRP-like cAMP-binding protein
MQRFLTVLKSYKRMPLELEQTLLENVQRIAIKKNEIVQPYLSIGNCLYFVEKGLFNLFATDSLGKQVTLRFKVEDEFIVSLTEVSPSGRGNGIEALEEGVLWAFPGSLVSRLKEEYSQFRLQYSAIITNDWVAIEQASHCSHSSGDRSNYDFMRQHLPHLVDRVPIPYLANFTNIPEKILGHLIKSEMKLNFSAKRR